MKIKTSLVILHYKNNQDTLDCLDSVFKSNFSGLDVSVILVMNGLSPDFKLKVQGLYSRVNFIINAENCGFAAGNNLGIKKALSFDSSHIILVNNDTVIDKNAILELVRFSMTDNTIGLVSPKIYFAPGFEFHNNKYLSAERGKVIWYAGGDIDWNNMYAKHRGVDEVDQGQYNSNTETDFTTGCCMLIKKKVIDEIGFLNEKYFMYYEDIDYSMKVRSKGLKAYYYPQAFIWHKNASSSGRPGSPLHVYYQTRNRLYFGMKFAPFRTKKSLLLESTKFLFQGGIRLKATLDCLLSRMGQQSYEN